MGEMADYTLDQIIDAEDYRLLYRTGGMSDAMAYDLGIIDELGYYSHPPMFLPRVTTKTCKHCGTKGLVWKNTGNGWRLATANGELHTCDKYVRQKMTDNMTEYAP